MKKEEPKIILNRIKTPDGTVLTSHHRHDYQIHEDANGETYMTDGGMDYIRRSSNKVHPEILDVYSDAPFTKIREALYRGGRGIDGTQPLTYVLLCDMSNAWIENCITYNTNQGFSGSFVSLLYEEELRYRHENNIIIEDTE